MTKEERLKILDEALDRALQDLDAADHLTGKDAYYLVRTIGDLDLLMGRIGYLVEGSPVGCEPGSERHAPTELVGAEMSEPQSERETTENPEPSLTKAEMVTRLSELGDACPGDNVIPGVMKSMGYEKLSQVPTARYEELLEKATAAVKEAK